MPNGGGYPSCRLCKWADKDIEAHKPSYGAFCRKYETQIILAGDFFCANLAMPEPPAFIAEENLVPDKLYMWSEVIYYGMYYSDIVPFALIADYKVMKQDDIIHRIRAINHAKQAEFEASHQKPDDK